MGIKIIFYLDKTRELGNKIGFVLILSIMLLAINGQSQLDFIKQAFAQEKDTSIPIDDSLMATVTPDHTESGDAGSLPGSAQDVTGTGSLNSISGSTTISSDLQDMFRICITNPGGFSATTVSMATFDTQLFLFDNGGIGIYSNDNDVGLHSTLPSGNIHSPTTPGIYYLAISGWNDEAVAVGVGEIFADTLSGVNPPIGTGGPGPITGWQTSSMAGGYVIGLTGAAGTTNCGAVGGEFMGIDSTAVLVAGTQTTAAWMIPIIVSAIGIAIFLARKF